MKQKLNLYSVFVYNLNNLLLQFSSQRCYFVRKVIIENKNCIKELKAKKLKSCIYNNLFLLKIRLKCMLS